MWGYFDITTEIAPLMPVWVERAFKCSSSITAQNHWKIENDIHQFHPRLRNNHHWKYTNALFRKIERGKLTKLQTWSIMMFSPTFGTVVVIQTAESDAYVSREWNAWTHESQFNETYNVSKSEPVKLAVLNLTLQNQHNWTPIEHDTISHWSSQLQYF